MKGHGLTSLASTFVVLGIVLGSTTNRLIGYSFIGVGVLISIISWIKSKKRSGNNEGSEW